MTRILTTAAVLAMLAATHASAATLFDDGFDNSVLADGPDGSVNGGFEIVTNNNNATGRSVTEGGTTAQIITGGANDNTGVISTRGFDATISDGFTATWVVDSQTGVGGAGFLNAELIIQSSTEFRNETSARPWFEFRIESTGQWSIRANEGGGDIVLFDGPGLVSGIPDGYTITLSANAAGWEVEGTGFGGNPNQSGAWSGGFDYSDFSNDTHVGAMIQNNGGADTVFLNVDSITLSQPETPFRNGGFEDYLGADDGDDGLPDDDENIRILTPSSWVETSDSPTVGLQTENFGALPHEGDYFVVFTGQPEGGAGIAQTFDTIAGQLYAVEFWLSRNQAANAPTLELDIFDGAAGRDGSGTGDLLDTEFLINTAEELWVQQIVTFVADSALTTIRFQEPVGSNSSGVGPLLDSISIEAIPTPAALPAGLAMLGLAATRRRRGCLAR